MSKLISVIVPVYNVEEYIEKCVNSIINQTYKNLEIILIDDGSTDNSGKICDEYKKKDNRIKVFHKKNGGLSSAKNYGLEKATGDWISFIDSDDWIEHTAFKKLSKEFSSNLDIIIFGRYLDYENGQSIKQCLNEKIIMNNKTALIKLNSFGGFDISSCDKIYKRELFTGIKFPFGKKCEDAYTTYKLFSKSNKIEYYPESFYHYLQRTGSISKSNSLNLDLIYASEEQIIFFEKNYPDVLFVAKSNFAYCVKTIYGMAIERKIKINDELKKYKRQCKKMRKIILNNKFLSIKNKLKFLLFNDFYLIYAFLMKF